jgi:hypothetical protein
LKKKKKENIEDSSCRISENPQSETRPHCSPDPSCGPEESQGGAIPFPQKNSLPRRVQISFKDFRQKMFEYQSIHSAYHEVTKVRSSRHLCCSAFGLVKSRFEQAENQL